MGVFSWNTQDTNKNTQDTNKHINMGVRDTKNTPDQVKQFNHII